MDNARAPVTLGDLAQFQEVLEVALQSFNKEVYKDAEVIEGEEVMTPRLEEKGTQKPFINTSGPPLMEEDGVVLCQALFQSIKEEVEVDRKMGVTSAGQRGCWSGKCGLDEDIERTILLSQS